jgi:hypothetical protein
MTATDVLHPAVTSGLIDLRDVPLAVVPDLDARTLDDLLARACFRGRPHNPGCQSQPSTLPSDLDSSI